MGVFKQTFRIISSNSSNSLTCSLPKSPPFGRKGKSPSTNTGRANLWDEGKSQSCTHRWGAVMNDISWFKCRKPHVNICQRICFLKERCWNENESLRYRANAAKQHGNGRSWIQLGDKGQQKHKNFKHEVQLVQFWKPWTFHPTKWDVVPPAPARRTFRGTGCKTCCHVGWLYRPVIHVMHSTTDCSPTSSMEAACPAFSGFRIFCFQSVGLPHSESHRRTADVLYGFWLCMHGE